MYRNQNYNINYKENPNFLNEFLNYNLVILNSSPNSVKELNYIIRDFLKYIKANKTKEENYKNLNISGLDIEILKKVKQLHIENYINYLQSNGLKNDTISKKICCIKNFFKYFTEKNSVLKINPAKNIKGIKRDNKLPVYLNLEQCKELLYDTFYDKSNQFSKRDYCIVVLFLNLGLRVSELVSIDIEDIDCDNNKITILGKGEKERILYLNKISIKAIREYLKQRTPPYLIKADEKHSERALFLTKSNTRVSIRLVQHIIKKTFESAGLDTKKYSVHKLRHSCATLLYQWGSVDIRTIQLILGHSDVETTEIYTHINNNYIRNIIKESQIVK